MNIAPTTTVALPNTFNFTGNYTKYHNNTRIMEPFSSQIHRLNITDRLF